MSATEGRPKLDAMRDRLRLLASDRPEISAFIESSLREFNGRSGDPASFTLLEHLLSKQHYLLSYWLDPNQGINYRRFFAISDLVGVRVEDPIVFEAMHDQIFQLISKGAKQGLRIGLRVHHIDGLRDPSGYLTRLQRCLSDTKPTDAPRAYVVVEKILARREQLPEDWPISGTTGYEYLNYLNGPLVQLEGCQQIEAIYCEFTGKQAAYAEVVYEKKKLVMNSLLRVEIQGLARQLAGLAAKDRYARNIPRLELSEALMEVTACMPVYRTYIRSLDVPPAARDAINQALTGAQAKRSELSRPCLDFLRDVLTLTNPPHIGAEQREERLAFVMRWQQFTGPIVVKGTPDFYQGSELWDLHLVDPDSRQPVDFAERCNALSAAADDGANPDVAFELMRRWSDGQIKMHVTRKALRYRLQYPELFTEGEFVPLITQGVRTQNIISILRHNGRDHALTVVPRWLAHTYAPDQKLPSVDFWAGTALLLPEFAPESWINVFTSERIDTHPAGKSRTLAIAEVLKCFPVVLLVPAASALEFDKALSQATKWSVAL